MVVQLLPPLAVQQEEDSICAMDRSGSIRYRHCGHERVVSLVAGDAGSVTFELSTFRNAQHVCRSLQGCWRQQSSKC